MNVSEGLLLRQARSVSHLRDSGDQERRRRSRDSAVAAATAARSRAGGASLRPMPVTLSAAEALGQDSTREGASEPVRPTEAELEYAEHQFVSPPWEYTFLRLPASGFMTSYLLKRVRCAGAARRARRTHLCPSHPPPPDAGRSLVSYSDSGDHLHLPSGPARGRKAQPRVRHRPAHLRGAPHGGAGAAPSRLQLAARHALRPPHGQQGVAGPLQLERRVRFCVSTVFPERHQQPGAPVPEGASQRRRPPPACSPG